MNYIFLFISSIMKDLYRLTYTLYLCISGKILKIWTINNYNTYGICISLQIFDLATSNASNELLIYLKFYSFISFSYVHYKLNANYQGIIKVSIYLGRIFVFFIFLFILRILVNIHIDVIKDIGDNQCFKYIIVIFG